MTSSVGQIRSDFLSEQLRNGWRISRARFTIADPITNPKASFFLTLTRDGIETLHEVPWFPEIEQLLFQHHVKMTHREEEVFRLAYFLNGNFSLIENQVGRQVVNSALVAVLDASEHREALADILQRVPRYDQSGSPFFENTHLYLSHAIRGLQNSLVMELGYPNDASTIELMRSALRTALDWRFHVSLREAFFPR
jgi:hypothetical protein